MLDKEIKVPFSSNPHDISHDSKGETRQVRAESAPVNDIGLHKPFQPFWHYDCNAIAKVYRMCTKRAHAWTSSALSVNGMCA